MTDVKTPLSRFVVIAPGVGVQLATVFRGESAEVVRENISWDEAFRHNRPRTGLSEPKHCLYFKAVSEEPIGECVSPTFEFSYLVSELDALRVRPEYFEWTIGRVPGVKALCMRKSEI